MPTMEKIVSDIFFGMFKGEPGTRKSTAALSFPTPQYWFNHDKKMQALLLPMRHLGIDATQVEYDNYTNYMEMENKIKALRLNNKFKTIIVDSITSMGDSINGQILDLKRGTTNKSGGAAGYKIGGIEVNTLDDYKAEAAAFMETVSALLDISSYSGCNIILIAHVIGNRDIKGEGEHTHFARVIVTGGKVVGAKIPAYCTEVYHFNVEPDIDVDKEGKYALYTVHTGNDFARIALPLAPKITFGNKSLYKEFIQPAQLKLKEK